MTGKIFKFLAAFLFLASFILILGNIQRIFAGTTPDFSVLWLSARDLLTGIDPYPDPRAFTPNGYPPMSLIFYVPLSLLPYQIAQAVFTLFSFEALVASVFLSIKLALGKVRWPIFLFALGLTFVSFPAKFSLGMGQINMIVLFLLLLSLFLELKEKSVPAGLVMGISIALKPQFAFFLLFFLLRKSWRVVRISLAVAAGIAILTLLIWPPEIWKSWLEIGILPLSNLAGRETYYNQGLMGFISRIFESIEIRKYLTGFMSLVLVIFSSVLAFKKKDPKLISSFFILVLLMIDTLSWQHHFVWLIFPFVILSAYAWRTKNAVFSGFIVLAFLLVAWNFKNPSAYPALLLSNQFYGALILLGINIKMLLTNL